MPLSDIAHSPFARSKANDRFDHAPPGSCGTAPANTEAPCCCTSHGGSAASASAQLALKSNPDPSAPAALAPGRTTAVRVPLERDGKFQELVAMSAVADSVMHSARVGFSAALCGSGGASVCSAVPSWPFAQSGSVFFGGEESRRKYMQVET